LFQAARWLGVGPWELMERSDIWRQRALFYMDVEQGVRNVKKNER